MEPITSFESTLVALPMDDIDTDQIIPARFLKVTDKAGLGTALFADWRFGPGGEPEPDFTLNRPESRGARVLLAGHNFGCGSSREHAPWALLGYGFRAVVSTGFADIFRSNALKNGLLPIVVADAAHARLVRLARATPAATVAVDLASQTLALPEGERIRFPIEPFAKRCLLNGVDQLGYLLSLEAEIGAYETGRAAARPDQPAARGTDGRGGAVVPAIDAAATLSRKETSK